MIILLLTPSYPSTACQHTCVAECASNGGYNILYPPFDIYPPFDPLSKAIMPKMLTLFCLVQIKKRSYYLNLLCVSIRFLERQFSPKTLSTNHCNFVKDYCIGTASPQFSPKTLSTNHCNFVKDYCIVIASLYSLVQRLFPLTTVSFVKDYCIGTASPQFSPNTLSANHCTFCQRQLLLLYYIYIYNYAAEEHSFWRMWPWWCFRVPCITGVDFS